MLLSTMNGIRYSIDPQNHEKNYLFVQKIFLFPTTHCLSNEFWRSSYCWKIIIVSEENVGCYP